MPSFPPIYRGTKGDLLPITMHLNRAVLQCPIPLQLGQQGRTQFFFEFCFALLSGDNSLSDDALAIKTDCV